MIEIEPGEFGHGRTRNLPPRSAPGTRIAFLTQDATPVGDSWLARWSRRSTPTARVGLSFGPHLPAARHEPDDRPRADRVLRDVRHGRRAPRSTRCAPGDPASGFFSNVNSAVLRECWEDMRFRDVGIRRGPGVRARRDGGRMAQGLRPGRRRAARARLPLARVHAPLLRRVPRPARDHRARRAGSARSHVARAGTGRDDAPTCARPGCSGPRTLAWTGCARCATTPAARCSPRWARAPTG